MEFATIVIIAIIVIALFFLKVEHIRRKVVIVVVLLFILFLYLTITNLSRTHSFDFKSVDGIANVVKVYLTWLGQSFDNLKILMGNAVKMRWFPENQTFSEYRDARKG